MGKYYAALDDDAWPQIGLRCVFGRRDYRPALDQPGGTRRRKRRDVSLGTRALRDPEGTTDRLSRQSSPHAPISAQILSMISSSVSWSPASLPFKPNDRGCQSLRNNPRKSRRSQSVEITIFFPLLPAQPIIFLGARLPWSSQRQESQGLSLAPGRRRGSIRQSTKAS
jgi:hypothetical protein